jgi:ABC-type nitrate/sulfonate/bicarbonate transport system substrate-binding protein
MNARALAAGLAAVAVLLNMPLRASAADTELNVVIFPGLQSLPLAIGQDKGFFAKRALKVEVTNTPSSQHLREGLAEERYQIAHGGVDNAVALAEAAHVGVAIVIGGNDGFNHLLVQPDIKSYGDLRGTTLAVDAPNTAYALLLYKMLQLKGLGRGDYAVKSVGAAFLRLQALTKDRTYAGSMLNVPYSIQAERAGLKDLGAAVTAVGPYLADGAYVLRSWAQANDEVVVRYLQAYVEALRWMVNRANKDDVIALMAQRLKLPPVIAARTYDIVTNPVGGFAKDAAFDEAGFRTVLKLRAEIEGQWGGIAPEPEQYVDLSYYQRALTGL